LAHRGLSRSEDETIIRAGEGTGGKGCVGNSPHDAAEIFGRRKDPHRSGGAARRGEHRRTVPARGIVQNLYYRWSKDFLEAGKKRLAGDTARAATSDEVRELRREASALKEVVAELTLENRLLKKSMIADGEYEGRDTPHPRKPRLSSWSSNRPFRSSVPWRSSASRGRPFTVGTISIKAVASKP
jgi:transposase-like protein